VHDGTMLARVHVVWEFKLLWDLLSTCVTIMFLPVL